MSLRVLVLTALSALLVACGGGNGAEPEHPTEKDGKKESVRPAVGDGEADDDLPTPQPPTEDGDWQALRAEASTS